MNKVFSIFLFGLLIHSSSSSQAVSLDEYSYGYWLNGWHKLELDKSPDILVLETNRYALALDMDDLATPHLGAINDSLSYEQALDNRDLDIESLPKANLLLQITLNGEVYTAKTSEAGLREDSYRLAAAQLWESARIAQHYELVNLEFKSQAGATLPALVDLHIVAWHNSISLTLDVKASSPAGQMALEDAQVQLSMKSALGQWQSTGRYSVGDKGKQKFTLTCNLDGPQQKEVTIKVNNDQGQNFPVQFNEQKNSYITHIDYVERDWKTGYTDIRDYDEFTIKVSGTKQSQSIPFLLRLDDVANITGFSPILCDSDGKPTGIPVQLSKNWHERSMGNYLMAYMSLPAKTKTHYYTLRIPYSFYGELPTASHSQLSLIGYTQKRGNGRWDQLAIGSFGETICFDVDMSCVDNMITDIRGLFLRNGKDGKKWSWTDAGWGGDWLNIKDEAQDKYYPKQLKTAYLSHGPCITDVRYSGYYGMNREVELMAQVQTLRTNDYNRVFQKLRYTFTQDVTPESISLFKLGKSFHYQTPAIAYGNKQGLIKEHQVPKTLKHRDLFLEDIPITGAAPWWVAFPQGQITKSNKGNGYKSLIIRDYKVVANGKTYTQPRFNSPNHAPHKHHSQPNLDLEILAPKEVTVFKAGDTIELNLELIALPRHIDDYYGNNQSFREHLSQHTNSWKTTHREAVMNDINLEVKGGVVENNYPIVIQKQADQIAVMIERAVGAVPISFKGLDSATDYSLYQLMNQKWVKFHPEVHGNDYWQTDYDPSTQTYQISYNLPLDAVENSKWLLKKE